MGTASYYDKIGKIEEGRDEHGNVARRIDVIILPFSKQGGLQKMKGSMSKRRLLIARWKYAHLATHNVYINVSTHKEVFRTTSDIVLPEHEDT